MESKTNRRAAGRPGARTHRRPHSARPRSASPGRRPARKQNGGSRGRKMPSFDPSHFINTNPAAPAAEVYTPTHTFADFGLTDTLAGTIAGLGLTTPTPIQDQTIPKILAGRDIIGLAETGTGKTAAFLIPLIEKTLADTSRQTLILTPTRELAIQIEGELKKLARGTSIHWTTCVGGANIGPQIKGLHRTNHFVIATPGRMLDLMQRKHFAGHDVTTVVLDEADRMLDMGFIGDIRTILGRTPKDRETLCFSATMSNAVRDLAHTFLHNPETVSVKKTDVVGTIAQDVVRFREKQKFDTLLQLLANDAYERVLVFGAMKHSVDRLAKDLKKHGVAAETIHGNKNHTQRQKALGNFKRGSARVLTATDVAARGIHVDNVSHVINYDLPQTFDDYVHRIGRTGRGSRTGKALTFVPARNT